MEKFKTIGVDIASGRDKTVYRCTINDRFVVFTIEPLSDDELEAIKADLKGAISLLKEMGFTAVQL